MCMYFRSNPLGLLVRWNLVETGLDQDHIYLIQDAIQAALQFGTITYYDVEGNIDYDVSFDEFSFHTATEHYLMSFPLDMQYDPEVMVDTESEQYRHLAEDIAGEVDQLYQGLEGEQIIRLVSME